MASDTVPAAVPGPNTPPPSTAPTHPATSGTQQPTDGLAGLLAPVQPTRTAFSLDPDPATAGVLAEQNVTDAHSAGYTTENPAAASPENTRKNTAGRQERSVIRAWMLAGAERWRKGADARNKRLDIKKARAQARQVKETVTVNRSENTGGGPSNSSGGGNSGAGKSLTSKSNKAPSGTGQKNKPSKGSTGGFGSSGGSGGGGSRTPSSSSTDRGTTNRTDKSAGPKNSSGAKPVKDGNGKSPSGGGASGKTNSGGGTGSSGTGGSGAGGHKHAADKTKNSDSPSSAKPGKDTTRTSGGSTASGKAGAQGPAGKPGKDAAQPPKTSDSKSGDKSGKVNLDRKTPKRDRGQQDGPAGDTAKKTPGPGYDAKAKDSNGQEPRGTDSAKDRETPKDGKADKDGKTNPTQTPAPQPRVDTRTSREAGYRDGTRVGHVIAHTQAYRDGYRDGRTDTAKAAADDKKRLDQAHADRKNARTQPEDKPVTQPASSTDYQPTIPPKPTHAPGPQPVPVTHIDATHVHLGDTAARPTISRGEVRTLRRFQQRLADKNDRMTQIAEATRTLEHHAQEQTKQITELLEQARSVKGGEKLVASLTKLAEAAQVQATKAAEINKRAVRSQEACKTLTTNTDTRYGGIYKAVVDSPETSPAEMAYYREMAHA